MKVLSELLWDALNKDGATDVRLEHNNVRKPEEFPDTFLRSSQKGLTLNPASEWEEPSLPPPAMMPTCVSKHQKGEGGGATLRSRK